MYHKFSSAYCSERIENSRVFSPLRWIIEVLSRNNLRCIAITRNLGAHRLDVILWELSACNEYTLNDELNYIRSLHKRAFNIACIQPFKVVWLGFLSQIVNIYVLNQDSSIEFRDFCTYNFNFNYLRNNQEKTYNFQS